MKFYPVQEFYGSTQIASVFFILYFYIGVFFFLEVWYITHMARISSYFLVTLIYFLVLFGKIFNEMHPFTGDHLIFTDILIVCFLQSIISWVLIWKLQSLNFNCLEFYTYMYVLILLNFLSTSANWSFFFFEWHVSILLDKLPACNFCSFIFLSYFNDL